MTPTLPEIILAGVCIGLLILLAMERHEHRLDRIDAADRARERERDLLNRIMARDYSQFAGFEPRESAPEPELTRAQEELLQAQQAVDYAGTIQ